ncbi:hypothetical protein IGI04_014674 [Brassica rapa subsp. trilocularis]|uniref:Uncharacterized protein n=1 Tax=Brassica rapa subsp. trilocularis TaxID=1813537 RepID=A0ABQ7MMU8_BRACM|nr:hypothetical protein IGI04_014674 [Brassica rapa subsp. trilocularis]
MYYIFRALNVYFNNLTEVNLDLELTRRWRITSSSCGREVALLGCYNASCKNTYAKLMPGCRWDNATNTLRLMKYSNIIELKSKHFHGLPMKLVLCCSGLTDE